MLSQEPTVLINGLYNDGKVSEQHQAVLNLDRITQGIVGILINSHNEPLWVHYDEIVFSSRLGSTPRELTIRKEALFITDDNDGIDKLLVALGGGDEGSLLYRLEKNLGIIALSLLVTVCVGWYLAIDGIPAAAKYIAFQIPDGIIFTEDDGLSVLDRTLFSKSELDAEKIKRLRALAQPYLDSHVSLRPILNFRSMGMANAFALPDGNIVFTDEFIRLTNKDEEFLAVLFHELGHLKHRHSIRRTLQGSIVTIILIMVTGDINSLDILVSLPTLALDLSYSRQFETESDTYALSQMRANNIDLDNFAKIMKRLEDYGINPNKPASDEGSSSNKFSDFLSTHPGTDDRVKLVATFKQQHGIE